MKKHNSNLTKQTSDNDSITDDKIPMVTIGLPVYNGDKYLESTLDCLLAQTYNNFELVISDDGSSDRTEEICRKYLNIDT